MTLSRNRKIWTTPKLIILHRALLEKIIILRLILLRNDSLSCVILIPLFFTRLSSIFDKLRMLNDTPSVKEVFKWVYGPIVEELLQVDYMPLVRLLF